jgi:hypothetical protein
MNAPVYKTAAWQWLFFFNGPCHVPVDRLDLHLISPPSVGAIAVSRIKNYSSGAIFERWPLASGIRTLPGGCNCRGFDKNGVGKRVLSHFPVLHALLIDKFNFSWARPWVAEFSRFLTLFPDIEVGAFLSRDINTPFRSHDLLKLMQGVIKISDRSISSRRLFLFYRIGCIDGRK